MHFIRPHQARYSLGLSSLFVFLPCSSITILILLLRHLDTGNGDGGHEYSGPRKGWWQLVLFSAFAEYSPSALYRLSSEDSTGE